MYGGIAVSRNLFCLTYTEGRGKVFLVDLGEKRPLDFWEYGGKDGGYSDAGGVAIDRDFAVYVADTHNEVVRRFTAFGKELETLGKEHKRAPGAACRDRTGYLERPHAVAVFDDHVLVACGDHHLRRGVQRFGLDGESLPPLLAFGDPEGEFGAPRGLCAGADGIFVADTLNGVVQRFTLEGRFVNEIATARVPSGMSRPIAVQSLHDGTILVIDQGDDPGLRHFDVSGKFLASPSATDDVVDPVALARDDEGRIYVLDRDGERVQRLCPDLSHDAQILDLAEYLHER
jgi:hypothetical protein